MIVITGATGNTGRPAAKALLAKGEVVRVIGRRPEKLDAITALNVLHLRPAQFTENLFMTAGPIRSMGVFPGSSPPRLPLRSIAARDIGECAASRPSARDFSGSSTQELRGPRDLHMKEEAASIVGQAVGKPGLGYLQLPFTRLEPALVQMGLPKAPLRCSSKLARAGIPAF